MIFAAALSFEIDALGSDLFLLLIRSDSLFLHLSLRAADGTLRVFVAGFS